QRTSDRTPSDRCRLRLHEYQLHEYQLHEYQVYATVVSRSCELPESTRAAAWLTWHSTEHGPRPAELTSTPAAPARQRSGVDACAVAAASSSGAGRGLATLGARAGRGRGAGRPRRRRRAGRRAARVVAVRSEEHTS